MNELDLDELDKAVSAMMNQPSTPGAAPKPEPTAPAAAATPAPAPTPEPAVMPSVVPEAPKSEPTPAMPEKPATTVPDREEIAVRRSTATIPTRQRLRGSAMDIVNTSAPVTKPPVTAPRVAPTITPAADQTPAAETVAEPIAPSVPTLSTADQKTITPPPEPVEEETKQPVETPTSPFVDTKVEKRPLGAYNAPAPEPAQPAPAAEAPTTMKATAPDVKEFSSEVIAAESADADKFVTSNSGFKPFGQTTAPQPQPEKPAEPSANIYDTKNYHAAPQMIVGKKKTSFLTILLIIILVIILAAAGAVAYLYFTNNLSALNGILNIFGISV